ncbi:MAG: hypothetical protein VW270_10125 [Candidatus Poseidoniales archaeon]|jgi:uncharacterized protein YoxC
MIGALMVGVNVARKAHKVKKAVNEVQDVMEALQDLTNTYEQIMADGEVTPEEAKMLIRKVGDIVREGSEAKLTLQKAF